MSVVQEIHSSTDNSVKILKFIMEFVEIAKLPSELQHYSNTGKKVGMGDLPNATCGVNIGFDNSGSPI